MRTVPLSLSLFLGFAVSGCVDDWANTVLPDPVIDRSFPEPETQSRVLPPIVSAERSPPPVSGGTLLVDGGLALAAEPDRDQIQIVNIRRQTQGNQPVLAVGATVNAQPGDEPGRIVAAGPGRYLVVLRGGSAIGRITQESGQWGMARLPVCASPRGIAFDELRERALVTCMDGQLLELDPANGQVERVQTLPDDLRDVVVTEDRVFITRFRTAEVIILTRVGKAFVSQSSLQAQVRGAERQANVAYRMVAIPDQLNTVAISHQLAATRTPVSTTRPGGYGSSAAGLDCVGSLVSSAVTTVDGEGNLATIEHPNVVLPVDLAVAPVRTTQNFGGSTAALVSAGATKMDESSSAPTRSPEHQSSQVVPASVPTSERFTDPCFPGAVVDSEGIQRTTAVAYTADGFMVRQTQNPHRLIVDDFSSVALPGESTFDTGHDLFFGNAGGGIACASCHAEGTDDAMVWNFETLGPRRTQEIRGGIMDTAPFHWDGEMNDFTHLTSDVMGERMSGPGLTDAHVASMSRWIDGLRFPARAPIEDMAAVERGREIFHDAQTACASCHNDDRFGSTAAFDVGTGMVAHVPGLAGVALRAPFMHTGCAKTLRERFNPFCGGSSHGSVEHLDEAGLNDLIAYLESL